MYEILEDVFQIAVRYGILILEAVGAVIIFISAVKALVCVVKSPDKGKNVFTEGIATALNFLLGSEVLKTIIAPDWRDIGMTCAIIAMRAAMTLLVHWESKHEKHEV